MPFWTNQTCKELLFYLESLTLSIAFLKYLGILPCMERYSKSSPGKDAAVFAVKILVRPFYHSVQISGRLRSLYRLGLQYKSKLLLLDNWYVFIFHE